MEEERIEEILKTQAEAPVVEERFRTPMTILFSDIKDSTAYFERNGDVKGLAMVERHNDLLFPCVENNRGRIGALHAWRDGIEGRWKNGTWSGTDLKSRSRSWNRISNRLGRWPSSGPAIRR